MNEGDEVMHIKQERNKKTIDFASIRSGCVFKCGTSFYIKGENGATNIETGQHLEPGANDPQWKDCYIYPKANMSLY